MASAKLILVAVDVADRNDLVLRWAAALARAEGASLLIATVEPGNPTSKFGHLYAGIADPGIADVAKALAMLEPPDGCPFEHRILSGSPGVELLKCAAAESAIAIVVGRHAGSHMQRLFAPGVVDEIVHGAHCPVLICKL